MRTKHASTELGQRLRALRLERGLNYYDLQERSGVDKGVTCRIESGESTAPMVSTLIALADALDTSLDYLCCRIAQEPEDINRANTDSVFRDLMTQYVTLNHESRLGLIQYARFLRDKQRGQHRKAS